MTYHSTIDPARPEVYEGAVSEQDYIAVYTDTCTACPGVDDGWTTWTSVGIDPSISR